MHDRYLEITFRKGKPFSAYLYLSGNGHTRSVRTEQIGPGLIVDFNSQGNPIGIEIISPSNTSVEEINKALASIQQPPMSESELLPLKAA